MCRRDSAGAASIHNASICSLARCLTGSPYGGNVEGFEAGERGGVGVADGKGARSTRWSHKTAAGTGRDVGAGLEDAAGTEAKFGKDGEDFALVEVDGYGGGGVEGRKEEEESEEGAPEHKGQADVLAIMVLS